jgi:hypothetical protein
MRINLTSLFLFLSLILFAQPYLNICSQGVSNYSKISDNSYRCLRFDTVQSLQGDDTLFVSFQVFRGYHSYWSDTTGGSLLGPRVIKKQNGWFSFLNKDKDTLKINATAGINDSFRFCGLANSGYVMAHIADLVLDTMMGTCDSVKIIAFQAKNSSGQNISHPINNVTLRLSKDYGFSRLSDFYYLPGADSAYIMIGKTNPLVGTQRPTWLDIFNFDVGDEFHFEHSEYDDIPHMSSETVWWEIRTVLTKTVSGGNSSVDYTEKRCRAQKITYYVTGGHWDDWSFINDTMLLHYDTTTGYDVNCLRYLPRENIPVSHYFFWENPTGFPEITGDYDGYMLNVIPDYHLTTFAKGLGETIDMIPLIWGFQQINTIPGPATLMVYYNKNGEIWGEPVAEDCNELLGIAPSRDYPVEGLLVVPNPIENEATVNIRSFISLRNAMATLYDYCGRVVREFPVDKNPISFSRSGFPSGIYLLIIHTDSCILRTKLVFD